MGKKPKEQTEMDFLNTKKETETKRTYTKRTRRTRENGLTVVIPNRYLADFLRSGIKYQVVAL